MIKHNQVQTPRLAEGQDITAYSRPVMRSAQTKIWAFNPVAPTAGIKFYDMSFLYGNAYSSVGDHKKSVTEDGRLVLVLASMESGEWRPGCPLSSSV